MQILNSILLALGSAARACWSTAGSACAWLGEALDALSPALSPVLAWINSACNVLAAGCYAVLDLLPAWLGLVIISAVAGLIMVVVFRHTSNQDGIRRVRDDIKANLLVLRLFKEDLRVALRTQGRLLWALLRLQGHMLLPIAVMLLPMVVVMAQMNLRYQHRSLRPGEQTVVRLRLEDAEASLPAPLELEGGEAVVTEVGPIAGGGMVLWRVRAGTPGRHALALQIGETSLHKAVVVGEGPQRLSAVRPGRHWMAQLLHPAEPPLPAALGLRAFEIEYAPRESFFDGADWWILWFVVLSVAFGVVFKSMLGVAM